MIDIRKRNWNVAQVARETAGLAGRIQRGPGSMRVRSEYGEHCDWVRPK
ncbi:hypothetical protein [Paraburkholderia ferrariae]|nr:hypothetical protein [Paraburkholderia ferrariae]